MFRSRVCLLHFTSAASVTSSRIPKRWVEFVWDSFRDSVKHRWDSISDLIVSYNTETGYCMLLDSLSSSEKFKLLGKVNVLFLYVQLVTPFSSCLIIAIGLIFFFSLKFKFSLKPGKGRRPAPNTVVCLVYLTFSFHSMFVWEVFSILNVLKPPGRLSL